MFKKTLFAALAGLMITAGTAVASEGKVVVSAVSETTGHEKGLGLEVAFPSLIMDHVRQQISIVSVTAPAGAHFAEETTFTAIAINPHYLFEVAEHFEIGVGPGLAYLAIPHHETTMLSVGVSLEYGIGDVRIGAQYNAPVDSTKFPDATTALKLGYAF